MSLLSPLRPLSDLLASEPRILNASLFPAPHTPQYYLLEAGIFELELLYLPQDTQLHKDRTFNSLFCGMTAFLESHNYRFDGMPFDFHSGHRGWLLDEKILESMPVHVVILHYPSLEGEKRFKDPNIAHQVMLHYLDQPESLYQRQYLDVLADLAGYGVQRESIHFSLGMWKPERPSTVSKQGCCCTVQ